MLPPLSAPKKSSLKSTMSVSVFLSWKKILSSIHPICWLKIAALYWSMNIKSAGAAWSSKLYPMLLHPPGRRYTCATKSGKEASSLLMSVRNAIISSRLLSWLPGLNRLAASNYLRPWKKSSSKGVSLFTFSAWATCSTA